MSAEEAQQAWTTALRSDEYEQTTGELCVIYSEGGKEHCCLGVACEVFGLTYSDASYGRGYDGQVAVLPPSVSAWLLGIEVAEISEFAKDPQIDIPSEYTERDTDNVGYHLRCTSLNDEYLLTFEQIADLVDYFGLKQ